MDEQQRKAFLKETFNTVANGYDGEALRFFSRSSQHMADLLFLSGNEHVLDVACGTGNASFAVAERLPAGRVTAVDFSGGMLEAARKKATARNVRNVAFLERDMTAIGLSESSFDAAVCAFGIFFVEDMETQLSHIASFVKPGGMVLISSFQNSYFQPLRDMMTDRITRFGVQLPPQPGKRIGHEAGCRALFEKAGLTDIRVEAKNVGYYLRNAEEWWAIVWNAGFRGMVSKLLPDDQARFRQEHLQEVEALGTDKGIWLEAAVLFTSGIKQ